jgi:hypothetical protein
MAMKYKYKTLIPVNDIAFQYFKRLFSFGFFITKTYQSARGKQTAFLY